MSSESSLDVPIVSRDDLSIEVSDRKSRRQRRASSDILKSPKITPSLFSKLSFSSELLHSKSHSQSSSSSNSLNKRPTTSSRISVESSGDNEGRISRWQITFDAVLEDELGLAAFSSFLRKEFSEENVLFWIDCHALQSLVDPCLIRQKVEKILFKYIGPKCEMPINLTNDLSKEALLEINYPSASSFLKQKDHIYQLMKLDSYPRFLRDGLFQKLVEIELDNRLITEGDILKIEKGEAIDPKKKDKRMSTFQKLFLNQANRKSVRRKKNDSKDGSSSTLSEQHSGSSLEVQEDQDRHRIGSICHIHFSDGGSTTIAPKASITARQLLTSVATRRGLSPGCIDWLLLNEGINQEPLSLENDSTCLNGRHIRGELRVTFRLDIVHIKRSIGIRSKIHKPISEVLQPIMARYLPDTPMQEIVVRLAGTKFPINLSDPVSILKDQRVVLEMKYLFRKPKSRVRRGEACSINQTTLEKLKRRRESISLRKRSRSRDTGLNRLSSIDVQPRSPSACKSDFDVRLSLGGKGQIDNQRGLLNKQDLILPDFLRNYDENENDDHVIDDDFEGFDTDYLKVPTREEAENMFGTARCTSSIFPNLQPSLKLFQDITNKEKLKDGDVPKKRSSLTKADLIDLPSPSKVKRMSSPKTSVV